MREYLVMVAVVTSGILLAAAVIFGVAQVTQPAKAVSVDLNKYSCALNGKTIECQRK